MKPLICFSGEAFQKNAGIAKEHMQFWQAICIFVIPSRQPKLNAHARSWLLFSHDATHHFK
jgi:hypothetical protein